MLSILWSTLSFGQLRPPVQTDTLIIKSVKYNFSELRKENWPCQKIYKSTTQFKFGNQTAEILSVRNLKYSGEYNCDKIEFEMTDGSKLYFYEKENSSTIVYSGYEFVCEKKQPIKTEQENDNAPLSGKFSLSGRKIVGIAAVPAYTAQDEGTVTVDIWVDNYGNVTKAQSGTTGTTTNNPKLLEASREAALRTHFNVNANAPALQKGRITYTFKMQK